MYNSETMSGHALPSRGEFPALAEESQPVLKGRSLRALRWFWLVIALLALAILISSWPGYMTKFAGQLYHTPSSQADSTTAPLAVASGIASLGSALLSYALAALLFKRRFQEPAAAATSFYLVVYSVIMAGPWEHWESVWLPGRSYAFILQGLLMTFPTFALFAYFPNGQIRPRWMRWVMLGSAPLGLALIAFAPFRETANTISLSVLGIIFLLLIGLAIYGQITRYRHISTQVERQQTKWVVFGFSLWFGYVFFSSIPYFYLTSLPAGAQVPWWAGISEFGWWLSLSIVPLSLTLAITRYKLWNIDIVINRSLVYGGLAFALIATYLVIIAGLGLLFQRSDSLFIPLIATGAAILLFQPLRGRLQAGVNRMMYGQRDEPAAVLSRLGEKLEESGTPQATLAGIVETVALALKIPFVAIELGEPTTTIVQHGRARPNSYRLPLTHQGEVIGYMLAAPRDQDGRLSAKDLEILETISHQTSMVAYAASLTSDLKRARQKLVTTREEERRRIRRDLHDGLGPQLASLNLKLDAAENLLTSNPDKAVDLLGESKIQVQAAVADIRRLVYNLRPPALDELGLMACLRQRAATYHSNSGMRVEVEGPAQLDGLPAAVEVAAYRIIDEAVHNASQHAAADHCWVRIKADTNLELVIEDDGPGMPSQFRAGVGIISMRERTEELAGTFQLEKRQPTGTRIQIFLPLSDEEGL